ncbi:biotin/lipoyl-containing protein [Nocardia rhamnosiphila]|uniref:Biotin/lipoyl-containing protein n=1 Tax=Nocardia rhamnosiphila TaxID=426716 RepID=A0ABV2X0N5_9NOCA
MIEIRIPQASMEMIEGEIDEWVVEDGATVTEGEIIYQLATDKVVVDIEAPAAGVLRQIGKEGVVYPVGEVIGHIEQ